MNIETISTSPHAYTQQEWDSRVELAALYRIINHYGMTDIANQEAGARVNGESECFLIHPYGLLYEEVCASDFVKVKLDASVIDGPGIWNQSGVENFANHAEERWVSDGGVNLGKWIFSTRKDVNVFIHGHCEDVIAVSATEKGLLAVSQATIYLSHLIAYLEYDFKEEEDYARLFMHTISDKDIIITRNHGYYTLGRTASEAFFRAYYLRQACSVQCKAGAAATGARDELHVINAERVALIQEQMVLSEHYHYDGSTEWGALLRKLERESPDYRS